MKTAIEELQDNKVKLTVTVPAAEVDKAVAGVYKTFGTRASIPGFRKGKVPRPVIDGFAGGKEVILAQATEDLINSTFPLAVDDTDVVPVGRPEFTQNLVAEGADYTYEVTVGVEPSFELSSYEPVTISLPSAEVSEQDIDSQLEYMTSHYADFVPKAEGEAIAMGDRVTMKIDAKTDGGRTISSLTNDDFSYTLGSVLMPEVFDSFLLGLKVGDKTSFEVPVPLEPSPYLAEVAGSALKACVNAEIKAIREKKNPELTDAWVADTFGMDTVADFREAIRNMVAQDKESALPRMKETRVYAALRARVMGEPPAAMCEDEESELLQNFFRQLRSNGITYDNYLNQMGITKEQFRDDLKMQAKDQCLEYLALDAWARKFGITATPEEITAEFVKADADHAAELEAEWRQEGQIHRVRRMVARDKAFHAIMDSAVVTEEAEEPAAAPAEEAPKPKKTRKPKKAAEPAPEAAEAAPAVEAAHAEEAPKPKRTRKPKAAAEPAPEAAEAAPAVEAAPAEEAPKPKRTRKPKAAAEAPAAE
ncbi:MAG: trigger factor [Eggerthellaceae bacterium]|nr:trigger factor [Eggerthellaceae bacterium]